MPARVWSRDVAARCHGAGQRASIDRAELVEAGSLLIVFTTAGAALLALSVVRPAAAAIPWCVLATAAIVMLRRRRRLAVETNLASEDDLPTDVSPLRLNVD